MKQEIRSERVRESYQKIDHPSGLTLLLYPMEGFSSAYAMLTTDYGSVDMAFRPTRKRTLPASLLGRPIFWSTRCLKMRMGTHLLNMRRPAHQPMRLLLLTKPLTCSAARITLKSRFAYCWSLSRLLFHPADGEQRAGNHRTGD